MNTVLVWIALLVGLAGALIGFITGSLRDTKERYGGREVTTAVAVVIGTAILFLLTLPSRPPVFSLGQKMGYGILIGGILGALAGLWAARMNGKTPWQAIMSTVGLASLALFGGSLVLLIFGSYPQPAMGGFIIGAVMAAVIFRIALPGLASMDTWALSVVSLGATVLISTFRYDTSTTRFWWPAPLMIFGAAIVTTIASSVFARRNRPFALPALVASLLTIGLTAILAWKVFPEWSLLWVVIAGIGTFAIVAWLGPISVNSAQAAAGMTLLVLALSALSFKFMAGFGIGIAMLAAWTILLSATASGLLNESEEAERPKAARAVIYGMWIVLGVLLVRLFMETYAADIRGLDLRAHYTLIALGIGAVFPFIITSFFPTVERRTYWSIIGAVALGLIAAATPLVILVLWGFKAALGFLVGTVAAKVFLLFIDTGAVKSGEASYDRSAVLVTTAQVSAVLISGLVAPLVDEPRHTKIFILGGVVLLGIIWAVITSLVARKSAREA